MSDRITAIWFATEACNYKCPYCWQQDKPLLSADVKLAGAAWTDAWTRLSPDLLDITGGEPMVLPWMVDMLAALPERVHFGLTTNLSQNILPLIKKVPAHRFWGFTCSWHPTGPMKMDVFLAKCRLLKERGYPVIVNFVTYPEQVHLLDLYAGIFGNWSLPFHVDPYAAFNAERTLELTEGEKALVAKYVKEDRSVHPWTVQYGSNYAVMCDAGQTYFHVQPDGKVWRCTTHRNHGMEPMGSIFDKDFKLTGHKEHCTLHHICAGCDRDKIHPDLCSK